MGSVNAVLPVLSQYTRHFLLLGTVIPLLLFGNWIVDCLVIVLSSSLQK